jgi:hypothetical protein
MVVVATNSMRTSFWAALETGAPATGRPYRPKAAYAIGAEQNGQTGRRRGNGHLPAAGTPHLTDRLSRVWPVSKVYRRH